MLHRQESTMYTTRNKIRKALSDPGILLVVSMVFLMEREFSSRVEFAAQVELYLVCVLC